MTHSFKWENTNGGKFGHTYNLSLRKNNFENTKRVWSLALDDAKWKNRFSLREVDKKGNTIMTWVQYLREYEY
jgi:hypothetical protein